MIVGANIELSMCFALVPANTFSRAVRPVFRGSRAFWLVFRGSRAFWLVFRGSRAGLGRLSISAQLSQQPASGDDGMGFEKFRVSPGIHFGSDNAV